MKVQIVLNVGADGAIRSLHSQGFSESLGLVHKRRASNVWPCHPIKRVAFRALRCLFGERGAVATWARKWRGPWEVRFVDDPHRVVFSHPSRRVCIAWEIDTINQQLLAQ